MLKHIAIVVLSGLSGLALMAQASSSIDDKIAELRAAAQANVATQYNVHDKLLSLSKHAESYNLALAFRTVDGILILETRYKKPADFPNPPQVGENAQKVYAYSQDGITINSTNSYIEIKADNYAKLVAVFAPNPNGFGRGIPIFSSSGYYYPNILTGYYNHTVEFNLETMQIFDTFASYNVRKSGSKALEYNTNADSVIGYRIGDGELKPILHDRQYYDYSELATSDVFTIYAKAGSGRVKLTAGAITVDKPNATIKVYRNYPFPTR